MCGIIGYTGTENAVPKIIDGLKALEYRGYDSAGIAVFENSGIKTIKAKGRIANIEEKLNNEHQGLYSECGIGHTRWATHGEPSDKNSHPHGTDNLMLVHNGIIENYTEIKKELTFIGYSFESETDTEVAAKLIDHSYKLEGDVFKAVTTAIAKLRGSYALGIIFKTMPGTIICARKHSPLIIAESESGSFIASDLPAVLKHTNKYYTLGKEEIAFVSKDKIEFFDFDKNPIKKELTISDLLPDVAEKGGFPHFMIKEINEEPDSVVRTVSPRITDNKISIFSDTLDDKLLSGFKRVKIVACGTAMHAGLVGKNAIETLARIPVDVEIASEFRYCNPIIDKDTLVIIISQSGETADSLAALKLAKKLGAYTLAIVNVLGSSIARAADSVLYTHAGPEIAVASTKAYTVQISVLYLIAIKFALLQGKIDDNQACEYIKILTNDVPESIRKALTKENELRKFAEKITNAKSLFFIGRGMDYCIAREASLKLKEISYIHCEAYAAGELKHGTISLITEDVPVVAVCTDETILEKALSNIKEVKARGAHVIVFCDENMNIPEDCADNIFRIPSLPSIFMPIPSATVLQLFAYHTSVLLGCDVDKPRNLAKSVTVE